MNRPTTRSLAFYLSLSLLGLALLPAVIILTMNETLVQDRLGSEFLNKNRLLSSALADSVATFLEPAENALAEINDELKIFGLESVYQQPLLDAKRINFEYFEIIQILDSRGVVVATSPYNPDHIGNSMVGQELFTGARDSARPYYSRSFISFQLGQPTVAISLQDRGREWLAVGYLNLKRLSDFVAGFLKDVNLHVRISDSSGTIIASHDIYEVSERMNLRRFMSSGLDRENGDQVVFIEGEREFLGSVTSIEPSRWRVIVASPKREILAVLEGARAFILLGLLASLLACGLLGYLLRRSILRPLGFLRENVRRLRDHDYSSMLKNPSGFQEFETLLAEFHQMQRTVDQRERELSSSLEQRELLLKEVHHRVKNNLQVIASLLNLQQRGARDEGLRESLRESANRVHAMSLVHEKIYQTADFAAIDLGQYLRELAASVFTSYHDNPSIELSIEAAEIMADIETAIPVGLIINEIISNSIKHAFKDGRSGKIFLRVDGSAGSIEIVVGDDGPGLPAGLNPHELETLGLQLIEALASQVGAVWSVAGPPGTVYSMRIMKPPAR